MMSMKDVRRGYTQAKFNKEASSWLFLEVFTIAIAMGLYYQSWWGFGGILFAMLIMLNVRVLAIVLLGLLSLLWGGVGWYISSCFWDTSAATVLGIILLLSTGGIHMSALEWVEDLNYKSEDETNKTE